LYQAYVAVRYRLTQRKVRRADGQKWLLIAELLDALEEDYRRIYPDEAPPFEEGYKEALRKLIIPK
jgi:hypothetical protein